MKQYIATISKSIIRDAQVFSGSAAEFEDLDFDESQELWYDDSVHDFFIGIVSGKDEETLKQEIAANEEVDPSFINLIPLSQEV